MSLPLHLNEQDTGHVSAVDASGRPSALPPGVIPVWTLSDATLGALFPATDGLSATFKPSDTALPAGATTVDVTITVSASLADGTVLTPATQVFTLSNTVPTALVVSFDAPVPKV